MHLTINDHAEQILFAMYVYGHPPLVKTIVLLLIAKGEGCDVFVCLFCACLFTMKDKANEDLVSWITAIITLIPTLSFLYVTKFLSRIYCDSSENTVIPDNETVLLQHTIVYIKLYTIVFGFKIRRHTQHHTCLKEKNESNNEG